MIRRLLCMRANGSSKRKGFIGAPPARGLYILPYVSIVNEKTQHLKDMLSSAALSVRGYSGQEMSSPLSHRVSWGCITSYFPLLLYVKAAV